MGDVVYGVAPIVTALKCKRREVYCLYVQEGLDNRQRKDKAALDFAIQAVKASGARVEHASKHDLNMLSNNRPHQGLVLDCSPLEFEQLDEFPAAASVDSSSGPPCWLALDEVVDPQNFGAAVRSALFLGAAGVVTCARNSAPLSGVVSKASAGAVEALPIHSATNLPRTLAMAVEAGWQVVGASAAPTSVSCQQFAMTRPTILVMGSEGAGLRTNVQRCCDTLLRIDAAPAHSHQQRPAVPVPEVLDSLNVSVATGILLHHVISSSTAAKRAQQHGAGRAEQPLVVSQQPDAAAAGQSPIAAA